MDDWAGFTGASFQLLFEEMRGAEFYMIDEVVRNEKRCGYGDD